MKPVYLIFMFLNLSCLNAQSKFDFKNNFCIIHYVFQMGHNNQQEYLNVIEISDISKELELIIDRYLFVTKKKIKKTCFKDAFIFLWIFPFFNEEMTKKIIYDSLYSINNFSKFDTLRKKIGSSYLITINLLNKNNPSFNTLKNQNKIYYYNYKGYKILLYSYYLELQFNELKNRKFQILENQNYIYNTKCDEFNYYIEKVFYLDNSYAIEIRYKDIVWPSGQTGRSMFK